MAFCNLFAATFTALTHESALSYLRDIVCTYFDAFSACASILRCGKVVGA